MAKLPVDPEYRRWKRKYPKFPGVDTCVDLLQSKNVQGAWIDIICDELERHAKVHPNELINAIRDPKNADVRLILLGPLENAVAPEAIVLFAELLESDDQEEQAYAVRGLKQINTPEARTILWNATEKGIQVQ